ncbi:hypothetical protein [Microbacterium sp.]|uniref:hypothetical protein n=1 Tax=Microbacterium sp. TaxID=51671 RepID=UPI0037C6A514
MTAVLAELSAAVTEVVQERAGYYDTWFVDDPYPVDAELDAAFAQIHGALSAAVDLFVSGFDRWSALIPFPELAHRIARLTDGVPYDKGTFRTDIVFEADGTPRMIEITCRFVMNGFLRHAIFEHLADRHGFARVRPDRYRVFLPVLADWLGADPVMIRGEEGRNDSEFLEWVFQAAGRTLTVLPPDALGPALDSLDGRRLVSEMNHSEISRLDDDTVRRLVDAGMRNDLRTAVLVHDKAFFAVMTLPEFQAALPPDAAGVLRRHLQPTWLAHLAPDLWAQARRNPAGWIMKPRNLGRSEGVLAGAMVSPAEWDAAWLAADPMTTVIQRFVDQPRWHTSLRGEPLQDFVAGTLLFAQEGYFGPGMFRLSSLPVTNVGDDRKAWG